MLIPKCVEKVEERPETLACQGKEQKQWQPAVPRGDGVRAESETRPAERPSPKPTITRKGKGKKLGKLNVNT